MLFAFVPSDSQGILRCCARKASHTSQMCVSALSVCLTSLATGRHQPSGFGITDLAGSYESRGDTRAHCSCVWFAATHVRRSNRFASLMCPCGWDPGLFELA